VKTSNDWIEGEDFYLEAVVVLKHLMTLVSFEVEVVAEASFRMELYEQDPIPKNFVEMNGPHRL
jgi:hypothetical protein